MCDTKNYYNQIRSVQDILRKDSLQEYYKNTILGFTILKRLMAILEDSEQDVLDAYNKMKASGRFDKDVLMAMSGHNYYNVSGIKFNDLLNDSKKIYQNIKTIVESFSDNVFDDENGIFGKKGIDLITTAKVLNDEGALYGVIKKYISLDLGKMTNTDMGTLFGQLICLTFGNVENGQNWTPSDFVDVLTTLLLAENCDHLKKGFHTIKLLDNAVGSGQLTSYFEKIVTEMNPLNEVMVFGQDNSNISIAICKAEQLMVGQKTERFVKANTLTEDPFYETDKKTGEEKPTEFDYILQNAPYGCGRKKADEGDIKKLLGDDLPGSGDNQMLFWKAAIRKLKVGGRCALLSNGSPLFSGSTLSGESKIRKWLFDNDYVEAIIKLTDQGFIDTGISIYAWIISKGGKSKQRKDWIQIIDASSIYHPLKKGIGNKRKEMTPEDVTEIVSLYKKFDPSNPSDKVKYMKKEDFYYYEVSVQQPYQRNFKISEDRLDNLYSQSTFNSLYDEDKYNDLLEEEGTIENLKKLKSYEDGKKLQENILSVLKANISDTIFDDMDAFSKHIKGLFDNLDAKYVKAIVTALSEKDKTSKTYPDKKTKSGLKADSELNDTEYVPYKENVQEYFDREVKLFVPDAWFNDDYDIKVGCEINFNKYFYKYEEPTSSEELLNELKNINEREKTLMEALFNDK